MPDEAFRSKRPLPEVNRQIARGRLPAAVLLVVSLLASACSSAPPLSPSPGATSAPPATTGSPAPTVPPTQTSRTVHVGLTNFKITLQPERISAGAIDLDVANEGTLVHELDIYQSALPINALPVDSSNEVDETSPDVKTIARSGPIDPGSSTLVKVTLPSGTYYFICNQPSHYIARMRLVVTIP